MVPFAVVGSEQLHEVMGRMVLGRQNGWGLVQIEDPGHCEFHHLRNLLIRLDEDHVKKENLLFNEFRISCLIVQQEPHARFDRVNFGDTLRGFPPASSNGNQRNSHRYQFVE